jgi:hypothetical protein
MLSDQDPDRDKIIMEHPKIRHEDTDLGSWKNSKGFEVEMMR